MCPVVMLLPRKQSWPPDPQWDGWMNGCMDRWMDGLPGVTEVSLVAPLAQHVHHAMMMFPPLGSLKDQDARSGYWKSRRRESHIVKWFVSVTINKNVLGGVALINLSPANLPPGSRRSATSSSEPLRVERPLAVINGTRPHIGSNEMRQLSG